MPSRLAQKLPRTGSFCLCYNAAMEFLNTFLGSATRAKVLKLFLFNETELFAMGEIAKRSQVSRENAQAEVRFLKRLGIIKKDTVVRAGKKVSGYIVDTANSHVGALQIFVRDISSTDQTSIVGKLKPAGRIKLIIGTGSFVDDDMGRVDLLIVGDSLDEKKLQVALRSVEADLGKELRYASFLTDEFQYRLTIYDKLIRDIFDYPHRVFLDKLGVTQSSTLG